MKRQRWRVLPIHVINLARAPDRLAHMAGELGRLGLDWQRFDATDRLSPGAAGPAAGFATGFATGRLARAFPATPGDIACSLSHLRLWHLIAEGPAAAAVVLEDDARLAPGFAGFASEAVVDLMGRHGMGALKLEFWPGPQQSRRRPVGRDLGPVGGGARLYRMHSSFLGTCGYVLTAEAARSLLRAFPRPCVPVDHLLFGAEAALGFDLLRPGFVNPAPVLHDTAAFASDIGAERVTRGRSAGRRLRDLVLRRRIAAAIARGEAAPVTMRFAGER
ncbi:MAG: hypothetical protein CVT84_14400 [Alphaproteobacteria bacterium HGW-Alphaproteobacteria-6]|nr:MAG: hypothetical protein CVT84_14400 [Alphaproteobacteria bacterium HGW-Alphaproteobacteria-6]